MRVIVARVIYFDVNVTCTARQRASKFDLRLEEIEIEIF